MEETLGNIPGTRHVFERWMSWQPDEAAWGSYIKLEKRYNEFTRARAIYERFTQIHPEPRNWIKWAKFEEEFGTSDTVREVFTVSIEHLGDEFIDEKLFIAFARFETKLKEYERARALYKFALDRLPRSKSQNLYNNYTTFEKQFGDREGVEDVIAAKRRVQYEELIKENPRIMTSGSTMRDWKKRKVKWTKFGKSMKERLHRYRQHKKRDTGGGISIYG